jgi:hypothetical protein
MQIMNNTYITQYNIIISSPSRDSLYNFYLTFSKKVADITLPKFSAYKDRNSNLFTFEFLGSFGDSLDNTLLDVVGDFVSDFPNVTLTGGFLDVYGSGFINQDLQKQYLNEKTL